MISSGLPLLIKT